MTYTYKGKEYPIQTGTKGGKYFIDDNKKKHYLKNENATPRKKKEKVEVIKPRRLQDYTVWIDVYNSDGEHIDDFKEWHACYSEQEALDYFKHEHPDNAFRHYKIEIFKIEPHEID